jgi:asparagine synthase (glutamine-hydrolysing)
MCGIAGAIGGRPVPPGALDVISHRGPDDQGDVYFEDVWLGHCRLAILDLSTNGHQPMSSHSEQYVIVFNGEIYNHLDLRRELEAKGVRFRSTSDTETILEGFAEWGIALFNKMNGIFAFGLLDKQNKKLYLVRDQLGVKPLYFYHNPGSFLFASEIKFFLNHPDFSAVLRPEMFLNYLQFLYSPGPDTLFQNVHKLAPGHYLKYSLTEKCFETIRYWDIPTQPQSGKRTLQDWEEELHAKLYQAVERQMLSDVPLGFHLSGGLDSSLIVAIAAKITGQRLQCYCIDNEHDLRAEGFVEDMDYARSVAQQLGVQLTAIPAKHNFFERFDSLIWHLDEPQADPATGHVFNISATARHQGIKVLLGGAGGDDIFTGYRRHMALRYEELIKLLPSPIIRLLQSVLATESESAILRRLKKVSGTLQLSTDERLVSYLKWIDTREVLPLLKERFETTPGELHFLKCLSRMPPKTALLNKSLRLELAGFLPDHNLNYTDKISMAESVETRVPYLDKELVEFAFQIPVNLKMKGHTTKFLLKKVGERYLSKDIIYRPKTGFAAPVRQWVKNDYRKVTDERLFDSDVLYRDFFRRDEVKKLVGRNDRGQVDGSFTILSLIAIESWLRQFYYRKK